jgi:hypothetical protein
MFPRHSQAEINKLERQAASIQKARGKTRFILWETTGSVVLWLITMPVVQLVYHRRLFSPDFLVVWLIMLPIYLLGGYLAGRWKWQDLEKKYPD